MSKLPEGQLTFDGEHYYIKYLEKYNSYVVQAKNKNGPFIMTNLARAEVNTLAEILVKSKIYIGEAFTRDDINKLAELVEIAERAQEAYSMGLFEFNEAAIGWTGSPEKALALDVELTRDCLDQAVGDTRDTDFIPQLFKALEAKGAIIDREAYPGTGQMTRKDLGRHYDNYYKTYVEEFYVAYNDVAVPVSGPFEDFKNVPSYPKITIGDRSTSISNSASPEAVANIIVNFLKDI